MTDTVRMKVTVTFEYDADPEHYPEHKREPFFMAEVDHYNYYMVDGALIEQINSIPSSQLDITVEPINGNN